MMRIQERKRTAVARQININKYIIEPKYRQNRSQLSTIYHREALRNRLSIGVFHLKMALFDCKISQTKQIKDEETSQRVHDAQSNKKKERNTKMYERET